MARNALIQVRRDTAANWTSVNPTLAAGELGLETDTGKFKIGTGSAAWTALTYGTDASKITGTTLASNVTGSSLTSVGTLTSLNVTGVTTSTSFAQGSDYLTPYTGFRNAIINGDFRINQRAFTSTTGSAAGVYGFDRWKQVNSGGTVTMSTQTFTVGSPAAAGYESPTFCRVVSASQSASGDYALLVQQIEDVRSLANSTITVSFWAKAASGTPKVALELQQGFGSGGSPSADVNTYGGQATLSTSWARYTLTTTVPNINGKTIGTTANTSFLGIHFWVSGGSTFNSRTGSLGIQNNTFDFWGVQVERGSVATPFEQRPIGTELALCQRYYWRMTATGQYSYFAQTLAVESGSVCYFAMRFPVTMRGRPSSMESANLHSVNVNAFAAASTVAPTYESTASSADSAGFYQSDTGKFSTTTSYALRANNNTGAYVAFNAEF